MNTTHRTTGPLRLLRLPLLAAGCLACVLGATPAAVASAPLPDLSGLWAMKNVTTGVAQIPVVGDVVTVSRGWLLVDIAQDGDRLTLTERVCKVDVITRPDPVRTILDQAFARAVSGQVRTARLSVDAAGSVRFEARQHLAVHGAELASPRVDELPTEPDDPRVVDPDGDGKPGLTVRVEGLVDGALYVVQRGWTVLSGAVDGADRVSGRVRWGSEQVVLDATNALLSDPPTMSPHRNGRLSYFEMSRVSAATDCAALEELGNRAFDRRAAQR